MSSLPNVWLSDNGNYWKAIWIDADGNRKSVSLGPKSAMSKRMAKSRIRDVALDLAHGKQVARTRASEPAIEWCRSWLAERQDLAVGSRKLYEGTIDYMEEYFGGVWLPKITRNAAAKWLAEMNGKDLSPSTVAGHLRRAKVMFAAALDRDLVPFSPFDKCKPPTIVSTKGKHPYITPAMADKIIAACPTDDWKRLIALCRFAGLRRNEALSLRWCDVDRKHGWLVVNADKTGTKGGLRKPPLSSHLAELLGEGTGDGPVVTVYKYNLHRNLVGFIEAARVKPYPQPFHQLRRSCESDWKKKYPPHIVHAWIGHSALVADRHYDIVPEEYYQ